MALGKSQKKLTSSNLISYAQNTPPQLFLDKGMMLSSACLVFTSIHKKYDILTVF